MEKLQLLESVLGKGSKTNRDYYQFNCPFHQGKNGPKLGISLGTGGWKCWVCPTKGNSVSSLFYKLKQSKDKIVLARELWHDKQVFKIEPKSTIELPPEFKPLWIDSGSFFNEKAIGFLETRNVTELDIIKHKIGYCETGKYANMIIFPSYSDNNQLVFWSGRTFNELSPFKFSIPPDIDKNIIFDENLVNWSEPVIIVESKLDAIAVKRNVTYLTGKRVCEKLKNKIIENGTPIIFCLDGDAQNDIIEQSEYFIQNGIDVKKVQLPENEDPSSLGYKKVWEFINKAEPITESEIFKFKMLKRL